MFRPWEAEGVGHEGGDDACEQRRVHNGAGGPSKWGDDVDVAGSGARSTDIALEKVVEAGLELPGFSTFEKMASKIHTKVNAPICEPPSAYRACTPAAGMGGNRGRRSSSHQQAP